MSLKEAEGLGISTDFIELHYLSHSGYYPGSDMIHMMVIFVKATGRLLGFQAIGKSGVDKKADILSTAIKGNLKIQELADLDLGYQPPCAPRKVTNFPKINKRIKTFENRK